MIPPKRNRKSPRPFDRELYQERRLVENFFFKLKQVRASATRYDKRATDFLGAVYLASTLIWLS